MTLIAADTHRLFFNFYILLIRVHLCP